MTQLTKSERQRAAAHQAAQWLVTLQAGELPRQQNVEFVDWLRESPLHVAEMLHACRLHRDLAAFDRWNRVAAFEGDNESRVLSLLSPEQHPARNVRPRRFGVGLAIAASCAGALVVGALVLGRFSESSWRTELGERREVTLTDGSVVALAPNSEVHARFQKNSRAISLVRGEALFHVAKDPGRPFIVTISNTQVRAVGTVFNVVQSDRAIAVTVVEGRVAVSGEDVTPPADTLEHSVPLSANQQLVISPTKHSSAVHSVRGELEVAWAAGQLVFQDEPVAEIVRRFNMYNKVQIQLADESLAQRRMGGMFRTTDPESFVAVLQSAGGVAVNRSNGVITIGSQANDSRFGTVR